MASKHIVGAVLVAAAMMAAPAARAADQTGTPAATNGGAAPVAGANSFTEGEAKSRIEKAGFTNVSALKQDNNGVWRGTASKNGQSGPVSLDFKGNVTGQ